MKKQANNAVQNIINLQALKESDERFHSIVLSSPDAIIVTDAKGKIEYMNPAAEKVFNRKLESFVGKDLGLALVNGVSTEIDIIRPGKDPGVGDMYVVETEWLGEKAHLITIRDITGSKRNETKLKQQADAMGTATDGMAILNEEGEFVYLNKAHARIYGYDNEGELIGKSWRNLYDSDVIQRFEQEFMPELSREGYWSGESIGTKKNGIKFPQELSLAAMANGGMICVVRDITERKEAEEQLRQSQRELQALMDVSPIGICWADMQGNIQYNNKKFRDLFGYTLEEIPSIAAWRLLAYPDPAYRAQVPSLVNSLTEAKKQAKEADPIEVNITCKDGSTRHVLQAGAFTSNRILVTYADITERRHQEEELLRMNTLLDSIVENIPDMIFIKDSKELRFVRFNRAGENLLGYSREEMLGKSDYDLFPHEQAQIFTQKDRDVLQGKKFVDIEEESIQTRNKGERVLRTRKVPLLNEEGEPEYLLGISEDITGRKEAETRFRELFNHISSGVAVYEAIDNGRDFIFRDFNPAAEKIEKINKKDLLGKRVTEVFPGVKEFGVFNVFQRVWKTGKMEYYPENIYKEGKNQESWRENWVYKLSTGEVVAVYNDITGRKQAEEALIKNEEMYRLVVDNMADVIAIIDMNLRFTYISPSIVRLLGYTVEEATAKTLEQFMTPESLQIVTRVFEEELKLEASGTADPGRIRTLELEEYRKDGSTVWLENRLSSFRDKENKLAGIIVLSHDITDRKQAEETLKESEKKYRLLADNVDDVIFVLDMNLNYTYASPSVKILMGYEPEELLKLRASETMTPSSWDLATKNLSKELEKYEQGEINKLQVLQLEMRRKDGSIVWTEVKVSFIRDENRRPVGIICVSRDITERKLAEAKLLETLNSLKKAFGTTIQVMVSAIEARDPYTSGHQSRAADIAGAIATEMGLPKERVVGILMAGSIHDIGKLSVPAEILSKPAKLSDIEFSLIKEHSHSGYEILKNVESPWPLAQIVYQHHERMDGSGYPRNLKGEEILLDARIMAVADVVEAMASHRPYRSALGIDAALEEIEKNKGIIYDATVADACLKLFREKGYKMIAQK